MRESDLQRQILDLLERLHIPAARINTGKLWVGGRCIRTAPPGFPDILAWPKGGGTVAIEVKRNDGKVTPEQLAWAMAIMDSGGRHVIARSVEDVLEAVG